MRNNFFLFLVLFFSFGIGAIVTKYILKDPPKPLSLKEKWEFVATGNIQTEILNSLGNPHLSRKVHVSEPFRGPQQQIFPILPQHGFYLEWEYREGSNSYVLWFSGNDKNNYLSWPLIGKSQYGTYAVF